MEVQPGIDIRLGDALAGLRSLPADSVDYVFTDPPYNINFVPPRGTHEAIANDNLPAEEFDRWLNAIAFELHRVMKPDTAAHVCTGWSSYPVFYVVFSRYFKIQACMVWKKNQFGIGYHTRPQHEFVILLLKGKPKPPSTAPSDIWEFTKVHKLKHSCEKPVALVAFAMGLYSKEGDLTCDPFMGSGATPEAAYRGGRGFIGWELDQKHFDTTKNRFRQVRFALA